MKPKSKERIKSCKKTNTWREILKSTGYITFITITCLFFALLCSCEFVEPQPFPDPTAVPTGETSTEPTVEPTCAPTEESTPTPTPTTFPPDSRSLAGYLRGFVWSPDSSMIAIAVSSFGDTWDCDIWIVNKELTAFQRIKKGEVENVYDWDGDWILFNKDKGEGLPDSYTGENEFWRIRSNGADEQQLTYTYSNGIRTEYWNHTYDNIGTAVDAQFISNTNLIYFLAHNGNGWYRSYTCNADGSDSWRNISYPDHTWTISTSPTGNKVFFASSSNYYTDFTFKFANPDGSGVTAVKGPMERCGYTLLSDGSGVAWSLNNIVSVINNDASNEHVVLNDIYTNAVLAHGRNSNELLVRSDRSDGNYHIYSVNCTTSGVTQLTTGDYNDGTGNFSPDGSYLAYLRLPDTYSGTTSVPYIELVVQSMN